MTIARFRKVCPGLYRGGAPSIDDVRHLKKMGIKKIVSLDKNTGDQIDDICKQDGIQHIKMYLDESYHALLHFITRNMHKLFLEDGPTFTHCKFGKDRTSLAIALVQVKYLGVKPEQAIKEAKALGFGVGFQPHIFHLYEKLIRSCKPVNKSDQNSADVVSNEREGTGDNRDSFRDHAEQGSWAPMTGNTRQWPMESVYTYTADQSPTRQNYLQPPISSHNDDDTKSSVPMVGEFDNEAGISGGAAGPTINMTGFIGESMVKMPLLSQPIIKKAYGVQLSYEVSDNEKRQAEMALLYFNVSEKLLMQANDFLDMMLTPFKNNPDMQPDDVIKARAAIRRFRDTSIDNFDKFKRSAFKCVNSMQAFSTDTQTLKLMKSFITSIDELEVKVNAFSDVFNDLQSKDFSKNVIGNIENIQKQCDDIEEIIDERIKTHIQTNILATSWVDSISSDLQMKIENKTPLIMDLYNKREDQLNDAVENKGVS